MDAREIESLSMLSRGFQELRDVNAELSYNVILDILAGLNEYVWKIVHAFCNCYLTILFFVFSSIGALLPTGMLLSDNTCKHRADSFHTEESHGRAR